MSGVRRPRRVTDVECGPINILVYGAPGVGKCLGRDTPVLLYDGRVKPVQEVVVGDQLMGPDSQPRNVLSACRGHDQLYRVVPVKGDPYIVNEPHILSLKITGTGQIVNISVKEYLEKDKPFKAKAKGYRVAVEFGEQPIVLDPYFLGVWLGDGTSRNVDITTVDPEVIESIREYASRNGLQFNTIENKDRVWSYRITSGRNNSPNPVLDALRQYRLLENKHIPHEYKVNSRENRLQLLAGIVDTDGYCSHGCIDLCLKSNTLSEDVVFLARSLGFAAYKRPCQKTCTNTGAIGEYYRICISGPTSEIPVKVPRRKSNERRQIKDVLVTGIQVESIGKGEYFGFELDGDRLFLLGDFTVTHNTVFGATGPGPILFLDIDEGLLSVRKMKRALAEELQIDRTQIYFEDVKSLEAMIAVVRRLGQDFQQDPNAWGTIVLDNLSELQRIVQQDRLQKEQRDMMQMKDWGIILHQMQLLVRLIKHLPCHTVFLAHEKDGQDGDTTKKIPALSGSISEKLPGQFDIIARYTLIEKEVADPTTNQIQTRTIRALRCTPTPKVQAKNRGGRLNDWEEPHLTRLIEKIAANE